MFDIVPARSRSLNIEIVAVAPDIAQSRRHEVSIPIRRGRDDESNTIDRFWRSFDPSVLIERQKTLRTTCNTCLVDAAFSERRLTRAAVSTHSRGRRTRIEPILLATVVAWRPVALTMASSTPGSNPAPGLKRSLLTEEDALCSVCRDGSVADGNEILFCEKCNIAVHQMCYGVGEVPEGDWYCAPCARGLTMEHTRCALCKFDGGALKPTKDGKQWAHVACVNWVPGPTFDDDDTLNAVEGLDAVDHQRYSLLCVSCKARGGACIQCDVRTCSVAFHPLCMLSDSRLSHALVSQPGNQWTWQALCPKHTTEATRKREAAIRATFEAQGRGQRGIRVKLRRIGRNPDRYMVVSVTGQSKSGALDVRRKSSTSGGSELGRGRRMRSSSIGRRHSISRSGRYSGTSSYSHADLPFAPIPDPRVLRLSEQMARDGAVRPTPTERGLYELWVQTVGAWYMPFNSQQLAMLQHPSVVDDRWHPFNDAEEMMHPPAKKSRRDETGSGAGARASSGDQPTSAPRGTESDSGAAPLTVLVQRLGVATRVDFEVRPAPHGTRGRDDEHWSSVRLSDGVRLLSEGEDPSLTSVLGGPEEMEVNTAGAGAGAGRSGGDDRTQDAPDAGEAVDVKLCGWKVFREAPMLSAPETSGSGESGPVLIDVGADADPLSLELAADQARLWSRERDVSQQLLKLRERILSSGEAPFLGLLEEEAGGAIDMQLTPDTSTTLRDDAHDPVRTAKVEVAFRHCESWRRVTGSLARGICDRDPRKPVAEAAVELPASWKIATAGRPSAEAAREAIAAKNKADQIDDNAVCVVCFDGDSTATNEIIYCDGCNVGVHQACYGVQVIPDGDWFCDRCRYIKGGGMRKHVVCSLCPFSDGAMKPTFDGRWVHMICAIWTPGVWIHNVTRMTGIDVAADATARYLPLATASGTAMKRLLKACMPGRLQPGRRVEEIEVSDVEDDSSVDDSSSRGDATQKIGAQAAADVVAKSALASSLGGDGAGQVTPAVISEAVPHSQPVQNFQTNGFPAGVVVAAGVVDAVSAAAGGEADLRAGGPLPHQPGAEGSLAVPLDASVGVAVPAAVVASGPAVPSEPPPGHPATVAPGEEVVPALDDGVQTLQYGGPCGLCNERLGRTVRCSEPECSASFHVTCAWFDGANMSAVSKGLHSFLYCGGGRGVGFKAYCRAHGHAAGGGRAHLQAEQKELRARYRSRENINVESARERRRQKKASEARAREAAKNGRGQAPQKQKVMHMAQPDVYAKGVCAVCFDPAVATTTAGSGEHGASAAAVAKPADAPSSDVAVCSSCGITVHPTCYGITSASSEPFQCDVCAAGSHPDRVQCELCPRKGGALKPTKARGRWAHLFCALYTPGVAFEDPDHMRGVDIHRVARQRFTKLKCHVCDGMAGACVQCEAKCYRPMHAMCAAQCGLYFDLIEIANGDVLRRVFCKPHTPKGFRFDEKTRRWVRLRLQDVVPPSFVKLRRLRSDFERLRMLLERVVRREKLKRQHLRMVSAEFVAERKVVGDTLWDDVSGAAAATGRKGKRRKVDTPPSNLPPPPAELVAHWAHQRELRAKAAAEAAAAEARAHAERVATQPLPFPEFPAPADATPFDASVSRRRPVGGLVRQRRLYPRGQSHPPTSNRLELDMRLMEIFRLVAQATAPASEFGELESSAAGGAGTGAGAEATKRSTRLLCAPFVDLPDPDEVPEYYDAVDVPVCLRNIERRILRQQYADDSALRDDFELMLANAAQFYGEDTTVYNDGQALNDAVERAFKLAAELAPAPSPGKRTSGEKKRRREALKAVNASSYPTGGSSEQSGAYKCAKCANIFTHRVAPPTEGSAGGSVTANPLSGATLPLIYAAPSGNAAAVDGEYPPFCCDSCLSHNKHGSAIVGWRVLAWKPTWEDWHAGTIDAFLAGSRRHRIKYDNDDWDFVDLTLVPLCPGEALKTRRMQTRLKLL